MGSIARKHRRLRRNLSSQRFVLHFTQKSCEAVFFLSHVAIIVFAEIHDHRRRQNPDDGDHDEKLDESETPAGILNFKF